MNRKLTVCAIFLFSLTQRPVIAALRENPPVSEEEIHNNKGNEFFNSGQFEDAINEWMEVLKLNPTNLLATENISLAQIKLKKQRELKNRQVVTDEQGSEIPSSKFDLGIGPMYFFPNDTDQSKDGTGWLVEFSHSIVPSCYFKTSFGQYDQKVKLDLSPSAEVDFGQMEISPLLLGVEYRPKVSTILSPHIGGGFGYFFISYQLDPALNAALAVLDIAATEEIKNTGGYYLDAGIDSFIDRKQCFSVSLGVKYLSVKPERKISMKNLNTGAYAIDTRTIDISGTVAQMMLRYWFR